MLFPGVYLFMDFNTPMLLYLAAGIGAFLFISEFMYIPGKQQPANAQQVGPPPVSEEKPKLWTEEERRRALQEQDERLNPNGHNNYR